ncbi:MAG: hypothetical protein BWY31_00980 [Lentisphaerae bacterium ADurb.Bin242]|nr:MAG: hypothetical protein BWY31_00980 [Lentisphaerae bacterium ADurb.Bin242]
MGEKEKIRQAIHNNRGNSTFPTRRKIGSTVRWSYIVASIFISTVVLTACFLYFRSSKTVAPPKNYELYVNPFPKTERQSPFAKSRDVPHEVLRLKPLYPSPQETVRLNLWCAAGLPGSENIDIDGITRTLEQWAVHVKRETDRHLYKYVQNPRDYYYSEAYFRMLMLVTVLQEDHGIRYNAELITEPSLDDLTKPFTSDSRDVFLHGLTTGKKEGTCASMPILYLVVGRMLSYPLKLAAAKSHLYLRWEDEQEVINLEASGRGLAVFPDEKYKEWPFQITPRELAKNFFLKSMTPEEELTVFLENRATILAAQCKWKEFFYIYKRVLELAPNHPLALNNQKYAVLQAKKAGLADVIYTPTGNVIVWVDKPELLPVALEAWHTAYESTVEARRLQQFSRDNIAPFIPNQNHPFHLAIQPPMPNQQIPYTRSFQPQKIGAFK